MKYPIKQKKNYCYKDNFVIISSQKYFSARQVVFSPVMA